MTLFGLELFSGIAPVAAGLLFLLYFAAAFIRGLLGFGSGAPTVLFSAFILPPHEAVILSVVVSTFAMLILLPDGIRHGRPGVAMPLMAGFAIAAVLGVWAFASLRAEWLTLVLGILLILATLGDLTNAMTRFAQRLDLTKRSVPLNLGLVSGFLGSIGGAGVGYFLSVYIRWATDGPADFRGTNILVSTFTNVWRVAWFAGFGLLAWHYAVELLLMAPVVAAGNLVGARASGTLSPERYFRIFQLVLLLGAIILTLKGVRGLV